MGFGNLSIGADANYDDIGDAPVRPPVYSALSKSRGSQPQSVYERALLALLHLAHETRSSAPSHPGPAIVAAGHVIAMCICGHQVKRIRCAGRACSAASGTTAATYRWARHAAPRHA